MKLIKLISIFALVLVSGVAFAATPGKIAVDSVSGKVTFVSADGTQRQFVSGDVFGENTRIVTDKESSTKIVLGNGTVIALKPGTTIEISQFEQNNPEAVEGKNFASFRSEPAETSGSLTTVRLVKGTATFKVAKLLASSKLTVKTRAGNILVKGTTFSVTDNGSFVSTAVVEGEVSVAPTGRGSVALNGGKAVSIPVSESGSVGNLSFRGLPPAQRDEILSEVGISAPASESGSSAVLSDDSGIGVDPEIPAYAQGAGVDGPNDTFITDENSPASAGN